MASLQILFILFFIQMGQWAQASQRACGAGVLSQAEIFYQLEHEGQLISPGFSKSGLFLYYRPYEMKAEILESLTQEMSALSYALYKSKLILNSDPWSALSEPLKKNYVEELIAHETKARGVDAVWNQKTLLIMERSDKAPAYLSKHPHFEFRRDLRDILNPELVSDLEQPAYTSGEVVNRSKQIISQTGYRGIHYHAFTELDVRFLSSSAQAIVSNLEVMNYKLALQAYSRDADNIYQSNLSPWLSAKSERLSQDLAQLQSMWPTRVAGEADTKNTFLALRFWERRGEKVLVSIELRGLMFPVNGQKVARVEGSAAPRETDFSQAQSYLKKAEALLKQWRDQSAKPQVSLDLDVDISSAAGRVALQMARPELREKVERFFLAFSEINYSVKGEIHRGMLLPFVTIKGKTLSKASVAFISELVKLIESFEASGVSPVLVFQVKGLYQDWARAQLADLPD
jgi:hypothetical protein